MSPGRRLLLLVTVLVLMPMTIAAQHAPVRHIVVFKFKPEATADRIGQVTRAFRELRDRIPGITAFENGVNNSPEAKDHGFTHVFLVTFENAAARDAYLPHPEHRKFGELLGALSIVTDVFVVDYVPSH